MGVFDTIGDFLGDAAKAAETVINAKKGGDQVVTSDRPEAAQEKREDVRLLVDPNIYLLLGAVALLLLLFFLFKPGRR